MTPATPYWRPRASCFWYYVLMSKGDPIPPVSADAPKAGEIYKHYKGDQYRIIEVALHSDETWNIVYEPLYDSAVAKLFTRPAGEWCQRVEWNGKQVPRFNKIS